MKSILNIKSILIVAIIGIVSLVFFNQSFAANTAKVNVDVANIRKTADATSSILEQVFKDQEVEILEKSGDWYKVKYNNIQGYLRKDLLNADEAPTEKTEVENTTVESNTNVTEQANATVEAKTEEVTTKQENATENKLDNENGTGMYTCKENVKLRIIPLILGNEIKEISKDATVNVLEINNKWALVESGTNRGWVLVSQIEKVNSEEPTEVKPEEKVEENVEENNEANQEETKTEEQPKEETNAAEPVAEPAKQEQAVEKTMYVSGEVVNVRKEESTSAETVSQVKKGTEVIVTSENNGWSKVKVNNQEGYIASTLLSDRKPEVTTSRSLEQPRQEITTETETTPATTNTTPAPAPASTSAESTKKETKSEQTTTTSSSKGQEVCNYARQYLGCKYKYGGTSPSGFDCSGFTQYVFKHFGVSLNRTAEAQASNGTYVSKSNLKAGDLLIFTHHAGIYLGNGTFIHAANSKKGVIVTSLSDSYYTKNYITARRIFN